MKGFISIEVMFPKSHHLQTTMMINVGNIESIGDNGKCGVITTQSQVILTKETYTDLIKLITEATN